MITKTIKSSKKSSEKTRARAIWAVLLAAMLVLALAPAAAFAAEPVSYIDAAGAEQSASATAVGSGDQTWSNGWYYVSGNVTISHSVEVNGNVTLILTDGAHLTVTSADHNAAIQVEAAYTNAAAGVNQAEASFTVYAQSGGTGKLTATNTLAGVSGSGAGAGIGSRGSFIGQIGSEGSDKGYNARHAGIIKIYGGIVNASSTYGAGIGGGSAGQEFLTNGTYSASLTEGGGSGSIAIYGGTVTAASFTGAGIGSGQGYLSEGSSRTGDMRDITISGGTVNATSTHGAGIGGGSGKENWLTMTGQLPIYLQGNGARGGVITVSGGTVTASRIGGGNGTDGSKGADKNNLLNDAGEIIDDVALVQAGDGGYGGHGGNAGVLTFLGGTVTSDYIGGGYGGVGGVGGGVSAGISGSGGHGGDGGSGGQITLSGGIVNSIRFGAGGNAGKGGKGGTVALVGNSNNGGNGGKGGNGATIAISGGNLITSASARTVDKVGSGGERGDYGIAGEILTGAGTIGNDGNKGSVGSSSPAITITGGSVSNGSGGFALLATPPTDGEEPVYENKQSGHSANTPVQIINNDITPSNTFWATADASGTLYLYSRKPAILPSSGVAICPTSGVFNDESFAFGEDDELPPQEFTITNSSGAAFANVTATLSSNSYFEISTALSSDTIADGETATVSVRPSGRLSAGSYTASLRIEGYDVSISAPLTLTVWGVIVGEQTGTPTAGTAGSAGYTMATGVSGGTAITLNNLNGVAGITLDASTVATAAIGFQTAIKINTTDKTPPGNHPLTLSVPRAGEGILTSNTFYLVVEASALETVTWVAFTAEEVGGGTEYGSGFILITFSSPVTGLTRDDITLTGATGSAFFSSNGTDTDTEWKHEINSVSVSGQISVNIQNFGEYQVVNNPQTVTVYAGAGSAADVTFTAEQVSGESGIADSTGIFLVFSEPVFGLAPDDITVTYGGTGAAVKGGTLAGFGDMWLASLASVGAEGDVDVSIGGDDEQFGAESGTVYTVTNNPQAVTVYKDITAPPTPYTDASLNVSGAAFDKNTCSTDYRDITVTLDPGDYTLTAILLGNAALAAGTDYYTAGGGAYTFKKEYLATLGTGAQVFVFDMDGGADPTLTVTVSYTLPATLTKYPVLSDFEIFTGSGSVATRVDADPSKFTRLTLVGAVAGQLNDAYGKNLPGLGPLSPLDFEVTSGSTIITLKESYLKTLVDGAYAFRAEFTDGYADLSLTVATGDSAGFIVGSSAAGAPGTGDDANIMLWLLVGATALICLAGVVRSFTGPGKRKRREGRAQMK